MQLIPSCNFMQILCKEIYFLKSEGGWVAEIVGPLSDLTKDNPQTISQIIGFVMFAKTNESDAPITVVSGCDFTHTD